MYAFLLVLGSVIAAAGLALVASGVSVQQHSFDASNVTPGTIAVVGGCILIGLGFLVRALLGVERALVGRPLPVPGRSTAAVGTVAVAAQESEAARIPVPPKPKATPHPPSAPAVAAVMPPAGRADIALDSLPSESAPLAQGGDVALSPKSPVRAEEDTGKIHYGPGGRTNGSAPAASAARIAVSGRPGRPAQPQAKGSIFDSLWPRQQRGIPQAQTAVVEPEDAPSALQVLHHAEGSPSAKSATALQPAPAAISILKSGVVEGMAYTLYSDGSIEAQLPSGTLRFGSIAELRNHIEQNG